MHNVHLYLTAVMHETRGMKEAASLVAAGLVDEALFIGLGEPGLAEHERVDEHRAIWRVKLSTRDLPRNLLVQTLKYAEWLVRILAWLRTHPAEVVHAHSLGTLPVAVAARWLFGSRVVYDCHELETETNLTYGARKWLKRVGERALIRGADAVLVVGDAIADWYRERYGIRRPLVVRNVPRVVGSTELPPSRLLRERFGVADQDVLFIYQGAFVRGRGIERLLRVFPKVAPDRHLVFMGFGELEPLIKAQAENHPNIHFQPVVAEDDVLAYTSSADVGICLIDNSCLSYYYSLPNKLYEYLLGGLAILINDFPEQRLVLERAECGWLAPAEDDALGAFINGLQRAEIDRCKENARIARRDISWDREVAPMLDAYRKLASKT